MRVLKHQAVCDKLGVSRTSLWRLGKLPDFPKPIQFAGLTGGYLEHEIDNWIETQAARREVAGAQREKK